MRVVATIEARMASTRLPGKVLRPILGRPMLAYLVERLSWIPEIDEIVVATTGHREDDPIDRLANELVVRCFRGSEEDVLDRVVQAACQAKAELIVETTGDSPLIDMALVSRMVQLFQTGCYDYVQPKIPGYPRGVGPRIFRLDALEEISLISQDPADREHVSIYFVEHPGRYRLHLIEPSFEHRRPELRFTVDVAEDFQLVSAIIEALYPVNQSFGLSEIIQFLDLHPELVLLNAHVSQKPLRPDPVTRRSG